MAYTVLARRYRSRTFDEVVGQEAIARTLKAAIKQSKVAHAYLFTGTRGVGKTSMARIFANTLNNPEGSDEIAQAIFTGQDTDVIEIDGASNRGVDEAREVIANSVYRPLRGRHKIYIIDEVHMLTKEAFNALLKTMEEPPEHVKFILCTTEPHKVPPTIQSRCQRFDFRNIPSQQIEGHLESVVKSEGLEAEPELIAAVARLGNGSMRDALSLLDRIIAGGEQTLTLGVLESMLGLPDREVVGRLLDAAADGDVKACLEQGAELLNRTSADQVCETLLDRCRDLMVLAACGPETELVELSGEARREEAERAGRFDAAGLVHMIALTESVQRALKSSSAPRALFDALLVRLALTEKLADVTALVAGSSGASTARAPAKKR
ncbi:MAG: DNA polymerase III subunit gamma/tau [Phycisphaeraceae bacterium]|nr:MAG: DNA polymerase III subunit gamma/tau [Phycisphaeraceae bacterium]